MAILAVGWGSWYAFVSQQRFVSLPRRLADIALDERWKRPQWDKAEALVGEDLITVAAGDTKLLLRARHHVRQRHDDLGRRTVALERLNREIHELEAAHPTP